MWECTDIQSYSNKIFSVLCTYFWHPLILLFMKSVVDSCGVMLFNITVKLYHAYLNCYICNCIISTVYYYSRKKFGESEN